MQELLLILHLFLFCYWLGGDIGVFYSSGFAADASLGIEARMTAAKIMLALDIVPRVCAALMLTVGGLLSEYSGISHPGWQLAAIIALAPLWAGMELIMHFKHDTPLGQGLAKFDNPFKIALMIICVVSVFWSFSTGHLAAAPWVGYKILVFAFIIFCSLMINKTVGPYIAGIQKIAAGQINDAENIAMAASLRQVKWAVVGIWAGLALAAILGVLKPGG
jgi:hypothetical protein